MPFAIEFGYLCWPSLSTEVTRLTVAALWAVGAATWRRFCPDFPSIGCCAKHKYLEDEKDVVAKSRVYSWRAKRLLLCHYWFTQWWSEWARHIVKLASFTGIAAQTYVGTNSHRIYVKPMTAKLCNVHAISVHLVKIAGLVLW